MKLLLVFLLVLPGQSIQDINNSSQHIQASIQTPAPEDGIPEITLNKTTQTRGFLQSTGAVRQKRQTQASTNLKWVTWWEHQDGLPDGAVGIYNSYRERTDYICKYICEAGFYSPDRAKACRFPNSTKKWSANKFEILVNEGNLENLVWKYGSWGSVPPNSVKTCSGSDIYVGKNKYGLGKVVVGQKCFFLPWGWDEYWYRYYDVLTYEIQRVSSEQISNVQYNTDQAKILNVPPETLKKSSITNNECREVVKTVTLQDTHQEEKRWDTSLAITIGVRTTITAKIPVIGSTGIELSVEGTKQSSWGTTVVNTKSYSSSVQVTIPPNHLCSVSMVGYKYRADIPYTALLTRTYDSGITKSAHITGIYKGVHIVEVHIVVDRCTPIPNAPSCN